MSLGPVGLAKKKKLGAGQTLGPSDFCSLWAFGPFFFILVFVLVALQIILGFWAFGVVGLGPRSIFGAFGPSGN